MKPLPKEFQFKCDEHSAEQCENLGIDARAWLLSNVGQYYFVEKSIVQDTSTYAYDKTELISLSDYLEETNISIETSNQLYENYVLPIVDTTLKLDAPPDIKPDHSDLIVELTGKYVAGFVSNNALDIFKYTEHVKNAMLYAEETVKQLKEKKYL